VSAPHVPPACEHFAAVHDVQARTHGCEQCLRLRAPWTQLRICLTCGHVGCCEDSRYAHALVHHQETGHPIIASLERGEAWTWCYPHGRYFVPSPVPLPRKLSALDRLIGRLLRR
jgi:uncharacterized UBP type Zn finger protein